MKQLTPEQFVQKLKNVIGQADTQFAFFLGAGCSASSGIPTAHALVKYYWFPRLRRLYGDDWIRKNMPHYDPQNPAAYFTDVVVNLFDTSAARQREIESLCDGRFPGFGYAALANLMSSHKGRFNVVLTTNFDDLAPDALYIYTQSRGLVIPHEGLAGFIDPARTDPMIVKLHGDLRLVPFSTPQQIQRLAHSVVENIRQVLQNRGLIFIGYGGNDPSIVNLLEELAPGQYLKHGVYWVSGQEPRGGIRYWLDKHEATWVENQDFDELMLLLSEEFSLPLPSHRGFDRFFERYRSRGHRAGFVPACRQSKSERNQERFVGIPGTDL